jgi:hypothetical protein
MAWQNWDQNNNDGRKNDAAWHFSNTVPEPLHFSSQWQFSPNAAMLEWPQTYRMPIATASGAFVILPIDGCMSQFDNNFTDEAAWEDQWAWGSMGNTPYDGLGGALDIEHKSPGLTACDRDIPPDDSNIVTPISISQEPGSFEKDFACVGKSYSTCRKGKPASLRNGEQIDRLRATTEASKPRWQVPSSNKDFCDMQYLTKNPAMAQFTDGQESRTPQNHDYLERIKLATLPIISVASSRQRSKACRARGSGSLLAEAESHTQSEKHYRSELNNQFSNLLEVLPIKNADGRSGSTMSVSKAETMDRAITYIETLEAEEKQLKEEGFILSGRLAAYKRLITGRGGHWERWPEN